MFDAGSPVGNAVNAARRASIKAVFQLWRWSCQTPSANNTAHATIVHNVGTSHWRAGAAML